MSRVSVYAGCTYPKPRVKLANRNLTKVNGKYSAVYTAKSVHVLRLPCFLEKTSFEIFMPNFIFEHTFFLHHSPFLVLFITLHHRINLWSETNDSRSFPRVTSDGWRVASSGWPVAGNDPPKENRCAYHLLEIMVRKWNDIYHSIWNISEIIGYRFNQCIHSFLSFWTFQLILVHFVIFPFCVWTGCSTDIPKDGGEGDYFVCWRWKSLLAPLKDWILNNLNPHLKLSSFYVDFRYFVSTMCCRVRTLLNVFSSVSHLQMISKQWLISAYKPL